MSKKRKQRVETGQIETGQGQKALASIAEGETQAPSELNLAGPVFEQFESWIDQQLETLVERWIHTAAPAAATIRRFSTHEAHPSEPA